MKSYSLIRIFSVALIAALGFSACDSLLESPSQTETSPVKVQLRTVTSDQPLGAPGKQQSLLSEDELVIEGDNGTLTITDLRFVLSKLELEGEGTDEDDDEEERDDDESRWDRAGELKVEDGELKLTNAFVDVPLDVTEEEVLTALGELEVVEGSYDKLEFKIEEPEFDDEDGRLLEEIRDEFPEWPEEASLVATGSFTPTGEEPRDFTVFFDAEVKIELELDPPLTVSGDETPTVTIDFDPTKLFEPFGTTVPDLSQHDYASTQELVEFKLEIEDSFDKVELKHDL